MQKTEVENFLAQGLELMGLSLDNQAEALARLSLYFEELKKWNRKINLVARSLDDRQILEDHFLDSLTLLSVLPAETRKQETLLDVGTGAGFPGLVLKAASPSLSITLIEPRKNRYYFLKHVARLLELKGAEVLDVRLEEKKMVQRLSAKKFSFITSRAFTDINRFTKLAAPYLEKDGRVVLMQGPAAVDELNRPALNEMNEKFVVVETKRLILPFAQKERWLISV